MMKKYLFFFAALLLYTACTDDLELYAPDVQSPESDVLAPCTMTRAEAMELMLSHGIGYGYNGVEGEVCNVPDVRSQVLDPNGLREADIMPEINRISDSPLTITSEAGFSLNELLEKVYFGGGASAEAVVVFKGSVRGTLQLYSQKKINSYFCKATARKNAFFSRIDWASVSEVVTNPDSLAKHPNILTKNFRSAIARLGSNPSRVQMDSLINRYGTHVVTKCELGGIMELDIRLEKDSIATIHQQNAIGEVALLSLYNHQSQSSDDEYDLKIVSSGDSRLTVRGGDSRQLEHVVMNFDWGRDAVSAEDISAWTSSISTDSDKRQALEMTSMEMVGIWEFIPDPRVAKMLKAYITDDKDLMLDLYGYQTFDNTSFPAVPVGTGHTGDWTFYDDEGTKMKSDGVPDCYNIEAGGRYVATLCREQIPEIDLSGSVWVAYPIYQRQVNIDTGLCLHNGKAYRVGWKFGEMEVTPIPGDGYGNRIYMTNGYLYPCPSDGVGYEESKICVTYEWPGSIGFDRFDQLFDNGNSKLIESDYYILQAYKEGGRFLLRDRYLNEQQGKLTALPNWNYDKDLNRMVRASDYSYYYDPTELEYINEHPDLFSFSPSSDTLVITKNGRLEGEVTVPLYVSPGVDLHLRGTFQKPIIICSSVHLYLNDIEAQQGIRCEGSGTLTLEDNTHNRVTGYGSWQPGISILDGWVLTIDGNTTGVMAVKGGEFAPAIGNITQPNDLISSHGGGLVINGGLIEAVGGDGGAPGIGSSSFGYCGNITISGGIVRATGTGSCAGIGSGCSDIKSSYSCCGDIKLTGGYIQAIGGEGAAAIGCGRCGDCASIYIAKTVGEVHAIKGKGASRAIGRIGTNRCRKVEIEWGANVVQE